MRSLLYWTLLAVAAATGREGAAAATGPAATGRDEDGSLRRRLAARDAEALTVFVAVRSGGWRRTPSVLKQILWVCCGGWGAAGSFTKLPTDASGGGSEL